MTLEEGREPKGRENISKSTIKVFEDLLIGTNILVEIPIKSIYIQIIFTCYALSGW